LILMCLIAENSSEHVMHILKEISKFIYPNTVINYRKLVT